MRSHLFERGINYFTLVPASGTLEAAPAAGYADLIADLTATGTTLKENGLKTLEGGTILVSQSCLIANPSALSEGSANRHLARHLVELMESHLQAGPYFRLTANIRGSSPEVVSTTILSRPKLAGLKGPTVSRVYNIAEEDWYSISLLIKKEALMDAVDHLRDCGGVEIAASQVSYLFKENSKAFDNLF